MGDKYLERVEFLVVEDNAFMRSILRRVLKTLDARSIHEAEDGRDAFRAMQTFEPDIAIVD